MVLMYIDQQVNDFIKEKILKWDFALTLTDMNKEHYHFDADFKTFLMSMIYKMQIIVFINDSKGLILGTDASSFLGFGDPPVRVHPPCHLYLLSYYCPTNQSYTNMINYYMYLAVDCTYHQFSHKHTPICCIHHPIQQLTIMVIAPST